MLLITGANGRLGRLIVEEVLRREPEVALAVSVRDVAAASASPRAASRFGEATAG
jgi:uncharacterized protein YbjT (DUF2867 family)